MKRYKKPRFTIIKLSIESLLQAGLGSGATDLDAKRQTIRIFDDSFDDLSIAEESDYATTTNTIEVW